MSKELRQLTDGTYTFTETENENLFHFFRNDREVLGDVRSVPIELFAQYLVMKDRNGELKQNQKYAGSIMYEISEDCKVMRLIVSDNQHNKKVTSNKKIEKHKVPKIKVEKLANFVRKIIK